MFSSIPDKYDLMNRILTLTLDQNWRKSSALEILSARPARVLDLCSGTGDLAGLVATLSDTLPEITCLDFSFPMLIAAGRKLSGKGLGTLLIQGDAAAMPFIDSAFDAVGISFAFRNITWNNKKRGTILSEIYRVLKPGGTFTIIETSQPDTRIPRMIYHFYMKFIAGLVGGLLSGHLDAYGYLARSACEYYTREKLTQVLTEAKFKNVHHKKFACGAVALTKAIK